MSTRILAVAILAACQSVSASDLTTEIVSGQEWQDTDGNRIDAHSGRVLWDPPSQKYFWHGMSVIGQSDSIVWHLVNCYSSQDLLSWTFEGVALNTSHYISRPKVLRHPDGYYVMWMKSTPNVVVAEASSPAGPFALIRQPFKLFGAGIGGATAFADPASSDAFLIYSQKPGPTNDQVRTMSVARLTEDWRDVSVMTASFPGHWEGPAMFFNKKEGFYYMWTSHTSGWNGSFGSVHYSRNMSASTWTQLDYNPTHNHSAWESQSSDIIAYPNDEAENPSFIYIADRFIPYINDGTSGGSRPVWLPICMESGLHNFSIPWADAWKPDQPPCDTLVV